MNRMKVNAAGHRINGTGIEMARNTCSGKTLLTNAEKLHTFPGDVAALKSITYNFFF